MGLSQRLELRQGQSLVMTPQLLQAIKLLQLSRLDLVAYVAEELERNPLLDVEEEPAPLLTAPEPERSASSEQELLSSPALADAPADAPHDALFPDEATPSILPDALASSLWSGGGASSSFDEAFDPFATLIVEESLHEHLVRQLEVATDDPTLRLIGRHLIDAIDESGYLSESVEHIAERLDADPAHVAHVLSLIHRFEPSGVGARHLGECLALQLQERNRLDPAMQAMLNRLDLVARRDVASLRKVCGVDEDDVLEMLAEIRQLEPKPGRAFGGPPIEPLVPDVFVRPAPDGSWLVELNAEALPKVLVNQSYFTTVSRGLKADEDKAYLNECLQNATWLTRSLEQRAKTILKVASEIVRQQDAFFMHGVAYLRPLNLKAIAEAIGMHESTVSRVTSNKVIGTPRGVFEMRYFFTSAIAATSHGGAAHSAESVRWRIKQLIDGEKPDAILSDDTIVALLKQEGIDIARRTVAKYREALRIPSSLERRRQKELAYA